MPNGRAKRKVWVFSKEAKIPRTTAWRTQKKGTEVVGGCTTTDLPIATLHSTERDIIELLQSPTIFESLTDSEKDDLHTAQRAPSSASDGQANDAVFYDEQLNEDPMVGEFVSLLVNSSDLVGDSDTSEESESDIELSTSLSSDSEQEDEESDIVDDLENDDNETSDDDLPLYEGAKVSKLGAMIVVMLFALRHKLSGQALIDLVKVLCALLPDSHKFVTSAYLLKKYFADLFGEPAPKKHSYSGNCLGRIRMGQAECLKDKCRDAKKKIENFLELDLHLRLCHLYRGKGSLLSNKLLNKPFLSNLVQNNVINPPVSYDFKSPSFNFDFLIMF